MKNTVKWLLLIMILALSARIVRYALDSRIEKDSVLYINMARDWAKHGTERAFDRNPRIPPLYLWLMMLGEKVGFGAENTGVAVSILAGTLTVLAVFAIAVAFLDTKTALIAAFLAAIHPSFVKDSPEVMRDVLFIFFFASALACFVQAAAERRLWFLWPAGGIVAGLATLTRNEGVEIMFVLIAWCIVETALAYFAAEYRERPEKLCTPVSRNRLKMLVSGTAVAIIFFTISTWPVQSALKNTSSTWTVIDERIPNYLGGIIGIKP